MKTIKQNTNDGARSLVSRIEEQVVALVKEHLAANHGELRPYRWGIDAFDAHFGEDRFADLLPAGALELIGDHIEELVVDAVRLHFGCSNVRFAVKDATMHIFGEHYWTPLEVKEAADKVRADDPTYTELFESWQDGLAER